MKEGTNGEMVVVTKSVTALTTLLKTEGLTSSSLKALKGCLGRPPAEGLRLPPATAGLAGTASPGRGLNPNCNSDGVNLPLAPENCLGFLPSLLPLPKPDPPKGLKPELSSLPGLKEPLFSSTGAAAGFLSGSLNGLAGTG